MYTYLCQNLSSEQSQESNNSSFARHAHFSSSTVRAAARGRAANYMLVDQEPDALVQADWQVAALPLP